MTFSDNFPEQEAIKQCQKGNLEHFGLLYDAYIKKIYNFLYYRLRHKETSEDLASLVFLKALENIESFKGEKAGFSTWLYRIARNCLFDHYRTKKEIYPLENTADIPLKTKLEDSVSSSLELQKIIKLLGNFTPEQQDLIYLRVWDGFSYKEIAEITGKSEAAAKMSVIRLLAKLKDHASLSAVYLLLLKYISCQ